jgi:hypothetical protein
MSFTHPSSSKEVSLARTLDLRTSGKAAVVTAVVSIDGEEVQERGSKGTVATDCALVDLCHRVSHRAVVDLGQRRVRPVSGGCF